jgi:Family of unknown function (DUF6311)
MSEMNGYDRRLLGVPAQGTEGPVFGSAPTWRRRRISHGDAIFALVSAIGFALVGVTFAIFIVGFRVVNPFDTSWLGGDPAQSYLGWKFFRNETHLNFPLGWSSAIGFPMGEPIAYLDSIPLVAMIFWPARYILPPDFQYLGPYFAFNCVLQLYFGYRICRRLSGNNELVGILGGLFFMTAPPFVLRASGHFALTSHWLILAALDIFFTTTPQSRKPRTKGSVAVSFLAGGIHPYLTFMVLLVLGAGNLRRVLSAKPFSLLPAFSFSICLAAAVTSLTIFGFIRPGESGLYPGPDYGDCSMNLLAPIDPMHYGDTLLLKPLPKVGPCQYEGYNYFGLGIILLGIVALGCRPSAARKLFTREGVAAWVIIGASLLLALSTKATAGNLILYEIPLQSLQTVLSAFQSSGRLFWPAYYLIVSGIIAAACVAFEGRKLILILSTVFLLQFADLKGLIRAIHSWAQNSGSTAFTDAGPWPMLGRNHRHLVVIPPWECNNHDTPGGRGGFWTFGKLAAQQNMTTNSFYAARISPRQREFFCNQQAMDLIKNGLDEKTAYVFASTATVLPMALRGHYCRAVDGVILCSIEDGRGGLDESLLNRFSRHLEQ